MCYHDLPDPLNETEKIYIANQVAKATLEGDLSKTVLAAWLPTIPFHPSNPMRGPYKLEREPDGSWSSKGKRILDAGDVGVEIEQVAERIKIDPKTAATWKGLTIDNRSDMPLFVGMKDGKFCSSGGTMHGWTVHADFPEKGYILHGYFENPPSLDSESF